MAQDDESLKQPRPNRIRMFVRFLCGAFFGSVFAAAVAFVFGGFSKPGWQTVLLVSPGALVCGYWATREWGTAPKMAHSNFSTRGLAIFVTLVCAYVATWPATKTYAEYRMPGGLPVDEFKSFVESSRPGSGYVYMSFDISSRSPLPLVILREDHVIWEDRIVKSQVTSNRRTYYIWIFGRTIELPFSSKWQHG